MPQSSLDFNAIEFNALDPDESDMALDESDIPAWVIEIVDEILPGWIPVELERTNGPTVPTYNLKGEWDGLSLEVSLTNHRVVSKIEQALNPTELPSIVWEWIQANYPGATVREAEQVTESSAVTYQLQILTGNLQEVETSIRFKNTGSESSSFGPVVTLNADSVPASPSASTLETNGDIASMRNPEASVVFKSESVTPPGLNSPAHVDSAAKVDPPTQAEFGVEHGGPEDKRSPLSEMQKNVQSPSTSTSDDVTIRALVPISRLFISDTSRWPTSLLPARSILENITIDVAAMELCLQQFLCDLDALAECLRPSADGPGVVSNVAIIAALLASTGLVNLRDRRDHGELEDDSLWTNSSWRWILGTTTQGEPLPQ